jgi:hypothetical protein
LSRNSKRKEKDTNIHNFGKELKKTDLFVSWKYNPKTGKNNEQAGHKKAEEQREQCHAL